MMEAIELDAAHQQKQLLLLQSPFLVEELEKRRFGLMGKTCWKQ